MHKEDTALWQRNDQVGKVTKIEHIGEVCVKMQGIYFDFAKIASQVVVTMQRTATTNDYFVYNIGKPEFTTNSYAIKSKAEFVTKSLNFDTNTFGRGIIIYNSEAAGNVYYFIDLLKLDAGFSFPAAGTCPTQLKGTTSKPIMRNCLDSELGFNEDDIVSILVWFNRVSSLQNSGTTMHFGLAFFS